MRASQRHCAKLQQQRALISALVVFLAAAVTQGGSTTFSPTDSDFPNPERGFYGWSGPDFVTQYDAGSVQANYDAGRRLVLATVQLNSYRTTSLPASFLDTLDARFAAIRNVGMKATLLFSYDQTDGGNDATSAQIAAHLAQLKPVLAANADVIPYMRAGFIGAWGEWHSSKNGNSCGFNSGTTTCATANANRLIVRDALLANVPATTQIQFRLPADVILWYPTPTAQPRVGIHNDCFLAGPTDQGTYASEAERTYTKARTAVAAFGGETCGTNVNRDTCADILSEGAQYHLAWLNKDWYPNMIAAWEAGGCLGQVTRTMGYRLQLDSVSAPVRTQRGFSLAVKISLRNVGWARILSARRVVVTFTNTATGASYVAGKGPSLRTLPPQAAASTSFSVNAKVPATLAAGLYEVQLSVPDVFAATAADTRFAVRFANTDNAALGHAWVASTARFKTGVLVRVTL